MQKLLNKKKTPDETTDILKSESQKSKNYKHNLFIPFGFCFEFYGCNLHFFASIFSTKEVSRSEG